MLKRIIFDSMLMDENSPDVSYFIFELESAFSAKQYHVLMSHHTHNITTLTLLEGRRNAKQPIHKPGYFKELTADRLINAAEVFEETLKEKI